MLFLDFMLSRKGQRVFQAANYLPAHPEVAALQADLKPGVRFKKVNYLGPEILFDKSNEWSDYFEKEFMRCACLYELDCEMVFFFRLDDFAS